MKLTIVVTDNAASKNGVGHGGLDFSSCNIPVTVWALQWNNDSGHIEYEGLSQNTVITELPAWATAVEEVWQTAEDAATAAIEEEEVLIESQQDDPALDAIMAQYPTVTKAYAEVVIAKVSSLEFELKVISGSYLYDRDVQNTMPFKPIGIACINLAGSGVAVLNKMSLFANEAAKYGIPIFSYLNDKSTQDALAQYSVDHMEQTQYTYDGNPFMYTVWTLEKEKQKADKDINLDRIATLDAGFTWNGNTFDADNLSRTNLAGYVAMVDASISLPADFTWRDVDNNDIVLTNETIKAFATAMNTFVNDTYVASWARKVNVRAASTIDGIRAI